MNRQPLDPRRQAAKRERAKRRGGDLFLYRRAFAECAERIGLLAEPPRRVRIATAPGLEWTARASGTGEARVVPLERFEPRSADLIIAVGLLDQVEDPALAAFILGQALEPGGHLIGAALGAGSLERLRSAILDAERSVGRAVQRFHPLLDAPSLAGLLSAAGLKDAVLDVDRVEVRYRSLDRLVGDLRDMGCASSLAGQIPALSRPLLGQVREKFSSGPDGGAERFDLLHFSAVSPIAV